MKEAAMQVIEIYCRIALQCCRDHLPNVQHLVVRAVSLNWAVFRSTTNQKVNVMQFI